MAVEIITPHFECVVELKRLLKIMGDDLSLSTATGPKYMFFTTKGDGEIVTLECDLPLDAVCAQICGHLLTLADMSYPLVEAAKMDFLGNTVGTSIEFARSTGPQGEMQYHIDIIAPKTRLVFKELGHEGGRYCDLTFIRF